MFNLLSTPKKFSPIGRHIPVSITRSGKRADHSQRPPGLRVTVADSDSGVPEGEIETGLGPFLLYACSGNKSGRTGLAVPNVC